MRGQLLDFYLNEYLTLLLLFKVIIKSDGLDLFYLGDERIKDLNPTPT